MSNEEKLKVEVISKEEHEALMSEFRKENKRLQTLLAKNQVQHESELNRVIAEKDEQVRQADLRNPFIKINLSSEPTLNEIESPKQITHDTSPI